MLNSSWLHWRLSDYILHNSPYSAGKH